MYYLLTATCPRCQNQFHVEGEPGDPPGREYRCQCPRCFQAFPVPVEEGVPQCGPTGWAVRAVALPPA